MPEGVDLDAVAARVRYVGSPEHKDMITTAGDVAATSRRVDLPASGKRHGACHSLVAVRYPAGIDW